MKKLAVWLLVICAIPTLALGQTVVYPTGNPTQDVEAVRAAVQAGGTVLLKAADAAGNPRAFDFGDYPVAGIDWDDFGSGYVALGISGEIIPIALFPGFTAYASVGNDVHLVGETTGGAITTIRGGTIPIRNFGPRFIPGVGVDMVFGLSSLTIEGIRFTQSALQSIYTTQLGFFPQVRQFVEARGLAVGINIRRSEFVDVQPAFGGSWYALAAVTDGPAGAVRIEENLVRFTPGRWDAAERAFEAQNGLPFQPELWEGFSIADLHSRGIIANNRLQGIDVGLLVYFDGRDVVRIADNRVELRPEGLVGISCQANHTYLVERNTVIARGANPDGIVVWGTDPEIGINGSTLRQNRVVMEGSEWGAITLFGRGDKNYFAQNQIEGTAAYAIGLIGDFFAPEALATANAYAGTQLSQFVPRDSMVYGPGVHVYFDVNTRANVFVGRSGTIRDLGQGNAITGVRQGGQGAGAALPAALAARRDLLKHWRR